MRHAAEASIVRFVRPEMPVPVTNDMDDYEPRSKTTNAAETNWSWRAVMVVKQRAELVGDDHKRMAGGA